MEVFREGKISFTAENKQTRDAEVFFNPERKFDRDMNVLLLNTIGRKELSGIDVFGGSGVRGLRLCSETDSFSSFVRNDIKTYESISKNIEDNKDVLKCGIECTNFNAIDLGAKGKRYDYIDIDPFGSPIRYSVEAIPSLNLGGIIAVTATDTAALYGKARKACAVKYGAFSYKTQYFREVGLRIMIKRMEEVANLFYRSITPLFFDVRKHYVRVYLKLGRVNLSRKIGYIYQCSRCPYRSVEEGSKCGHCGSKLVRIGPLWLDKTFDKGLVEKMHDSTDDGKIGKYLGVLKDESDIPFFYTTAEISSFTRTVEKPVESFGSRTVLDSKGFRSDLDIDRILEMAKK